MAEETPTTPAPHGARPGLQPRLLQTPENAKVVAHGPSSALLEPSPPSLGTAKSGEDRGHPERSMVIRAYLWRGAQSFHTLILPLRGQDGLSGQYSRPSRDALLPSVTPILFMPWCRYSVKLPSTDKAFCGRISTLALVSVEPTRKERRWRCARWVA
ncbi:hypothetical protein VTN96DRAFT_3935 [Rasamsonia emersonii]